MVAGSRAAMSGGSPWPLMCRGASLHRVQERAREQCYLSGVTVLAGPDGAGGESRPAWPGDVVELYATDLRLVYPPITDGENSWGLQDICPTEAPNAMLRHTVGQPRVSIGGVEVAEDNLLFSGPVAVNAPEGVGPAVTAEACSPCLGFGLSFSFAVPRRSQANRPVRRTREIQ